MARQRLNPGAFVLPMPVALIGAEVAGRANFMTAAFAGIVNMQPPMVALGLGTTHATSRAIEEHGVFSLNLPSEEQAVRADYCGLHSGNNTDKSDVFPTISGDETGVPLIADCPLSVECRLVHSKPLGPDTLYVGEIVAAYVDESCLRAGEPNWEAIRPLLFTFPDRLYRRLGEGIGKAWDIGKGYTPANRPRKGDAHEYDHREEEAGR